MMNLFMIVSLYGKIVMSIGPLPYDMQECLVRAEERRQETHERFQSPPIAAQLAPLTEADVRVQCVRAERRPALGLATPPAGEGR